MSDQERDYHTVYHPERMEVVRVDQSIGVQIERDEVAMWRRRVAEFSEKLQGHERTALETVLRLLVHPG